jgi:hypothetical protein
VQESWAIYEGTEMLNFYLAIFAAFEFFSFRHKRQLWRELILEAENNAPKDLVDV